MQKTATSGYSSARTLVDGRYGSRPYKRLFDLAIGFLLLILFAPVGIVVALLVRLTSPGPILFRQERIGKDGQPFTVYKFRTMRHGADASIHEQYFIQYIQGVTAPGEDGASYKMHHDPRITPFGSILRRLALDEIPQIINVIKGDMSLVGPRPPLGYEVDHYSPRDLQRLTVKPGMTGLWQIKGRDTVDFATMVDLDLEYIHRQSLWLDLTIVIATVPVLVWAYVTR